MTSQDQFYCWACCFICVFLIIHNIVDGAHESSSQCFKWIPNGLWVFCRGRRRQRRKMKSLWGWIKASWMNSLTRFVEISFFSRTRTSAIHNLEKTKAGSTFRASESLSVDLRDHRNFCEISRGVTLSEAFLQDTLDVLCYVPAVSSPQATPYWCFNDERTCTKIEDRGCTFILKEVCASKRLFFLIKQVGNTYFLSTKLCLSWS